MEPTRRVLPKPRPSSVRVLFTSLGVALLIGIASGAASVAHASALKADALEQRLGVSRLSVQSLAVASRDASVHLDLDGRRVTLQLAPSQLRAPGFRVLASDASGALHEVPAPAGATVRGTVRELEGSSVGGTVRNGTLRAAIALADGRVFYVQPLGEIDPEAGATQHAVYDAADAVVGSEGVCATSEHSVLVPPGLGARQAPAVAALRIAELAFDADFEFYTLNGNSVDNTVNDIENVVSAVNVVYERDCEITHQVTSILVRSAEPDPYTSTAAGTLLTQFRDHWNAQQVGIARDVAHLMTGKNVDGGTIGIASVGAVCSRTRAYGVSQSRFSTNLSRRCALTAHELGHNWNAEHCDGVNPCNIMCSSINGCNGIGLPNFEPVGIQAITEFAASRTCLQTPPMAVDPPPSPLMVRLSEPVPSPFTGTTGLNFYVERSVAAELAIFDVAGHRVARLAKGVQSSGWHPVTWDGRDESGRSLLPGVYYAQLSVGHETVTQKLVLLR